MERKDWRKEPSRQIAVIKTNKALLELVDALKPAGRKFPAHLHAARQEDEEGERSLVRLQAVDYSKGKGDFSVSAYANISPEEVRFLYSRVYNCVQEFTYSQDKIFGEAPKPGYAIMTRLYISRYPQDKQGKKMERPWYVNIKNGAGIPLRNDNGGTYCKPNSFVCEREVAIQLTDMEFFKLFCKAEAWIAVFEQEHAYKERHLDNFKNLYLLLKREIKNAAEEILADRNTESGRAA